MTPSCTGSTRLIFIVGDPIAQVKSPQSVSPLLRDHGSDLTVVPAHVKPDHLADFMLMTERMPNVEGVIVTVPHKFKALSFCNELSARARLSGAVNLMRRSNHGGWYGDMQDGIGHVTALRRKGFDPRGKRVLLLGAGGAGSAISLALAEGGIGALFLYDLSAERLGDLTLKLRSQGILIPQIGSPDPFGFDLVVNATTLGMHPEDKLPIVPSRLQSETFVSDVITSPDIPPLIRTARQMGCQTLSGSEMFETMRDLIVAFYLGTGARS